MHHAMWNDPVLRFVAPLRQLGMCADEWGTIAHDERGRPFGHRSRGCRHVTKGRDRVAGGIPATPPRDRAEEGILYYIQRYRLAGGDRLPAERDLAEELGVSRTALRAAIGRLESAHMLERRHGAGTFICPVKPVNIFEDTYSYSDSVRAVGRTPGSLVISARWKTADAALAERSGLAEGASIFELCRVRLADEHPVSIETSSINGSLCPGIDRFDFGSEELYRVLERAYGIRVEHGVERISISRANGDEADHLGIAKGAPVFFESALEYDAERTLVEYVKTVINPARYRFASLSGKREVVSKEALAWLNA